MNVLDNEIRKNGFNYKLLKRTEKFAMYSQWDGDKLIGYEIFKIKIQPAKTVLNKDFPEKERFPNNEAFGYWAWQARSRSRAEEIYLQIKQFDRRLLPKEINNKIINLSDKNLPNRA